MPIHAPSTNNAADDEVDLRALACTLWKNKGSVIATCAFTTILATGYAYTATPVYETTMVVLPPTTSALIQFNNQPVKLKGSDAASLMFYYLLIKSTKTKFDAFVEEKYPDTPIPSVSISQKPTGEMIITLTSSQPELLPRQAEDYANIAAALGRNEYNLQLKATRIALQKKLEDDLAVAIEIAASPSQSPEILSWRDAEIITLRARLAETKANIDTTLDVPMYIVDSPAATPKAPIKPQRKLIIVFGAILGGMLGTFWVLIRQAFRRS